MSDQTFADSMPQAVAPGPPDAPEPSAATRRFQACRWHKAADNGLAAHCTHRDVLPMAGVAGFNPDAWCADCSCYKLRRAPRKPGMSPGFDRGA